MILAHNDQIVMEPTLNDALIKLIGNRISNLNNTPTPFKRSSDQTLTTLLDTIQAEYRQLKEASKRSDFETFGRQLQKLDKLIQSIEQYKQKN